MELTKFRGKWGGTIETEQGKLEEMWWSEPDARLADGNSWRRFLFALDVRQNFMLRYFRDWARANPERAERPQLVDYGCGTGGTTLNFASFLRRPIRGLDIFETQLRIAREFAARHEATRDCRFELLGEEGSIPGEPGSVDLIFSMDVLGHVPSIPRTLKAWHRALRPGTGEVSLFTEAGYSAEDSSIMARLARRTGVDLLAAVPEHISLFPREELERMFKDAGFEILHRASANVWHFFFFPKDYVLLLRGRSEARGLYALAWVWNRLSKLFPFYPWPFQALRLAVTRAFGGNAWGSGYFYRLRRLS